MNTTTNNTLHDAALGLLIAANERICALETQISLRDEVIYRLTMRGRPMSNASRHKLPVVRMGVDVRSAPLPKGAK
jgi:hypothetical protein